jgi:hypothetical protein
MRIAIDHCGAGDPSLGNLRRFSFDEVKVDHFLAGAHEHVRRSPQSSGPPASAAARAGADRKARKALASADLARQEKVRASRKNRLQPAGACGRDQVVMIRAATARRRTGVPSDRPPITNGYVKCFP